MSDFTQLKTDIASWIERGDLASNIITFITLAELRLCRTLHLMWLTKMSAHTITDVDADIQLPGSFNGFRTVRINTNPIRSLSYMQPEEINVLNLENAANQASTNYTILGNRMRVVPPAQIDQVIQVVYYFKPAVLSDSNLENEFTDNCYDLLLYASCLEAKAFVKDDKRLSTWAQMYKDGVAMIESQDEKQRWGESALEMSSDYSANPVDGITSTG